MSNQEVSFPSLLLLLIVGAIAVWYFFSPSSQPQPRDTQTVQRAREAAVERIQQVFPHIDRRSILWDLQRTGGNVNATTERILSGRLVTPPITFQPPPPPPGTRPAGVPNVVASPAIDSSPQQDLITRYNLQSKLRQVPEPEPEPSERKGKSWSSNKDERQALLQKRRDDMILAARRKMEARIAAEKAALRN